MINTAICVAMRDAAITTYRTSTGMSRHSASVQANPPVTGLVTHRRAVQVTERGCRTSSSTTDPTPLSKTMTVGNLPL